MSTMSRRPAHSPLPPGERGTLLLVDYSSTFNTVVPSRLDGKLWGLGLNASLCLWILDFLTDRSPMVRANHMLSVEWLLVVDRVQFLAMGLV